MRRRRPRCAGRPRPSGREAMIVCTSRPMPLPSDPRAEHDRLLGVGRRTVCGSEQRRRRAARTRRPGPFPLPLGPSSVFGDRRHRRSRRPRGRRSIEQRPTDSNPPQPDIRVGLRASHLACEVSFAHRAPDIHDRCYVNQKRVVPWCASDRGAMTMDPHDEPGYRTQRRCRRRAGSTSLTSNEPPGGRYLSMKTQLDARLAADLRQDLAIIEL